MTEERKLMCSILVPPGCLNLPTGMFPSESRQKFQAKFYLFKNHFEQNKC
jgi:hypothetical protein